MKIYLMLFLSAVQGSLSLGQSPGTFTATGNMTTPRLQHTATLLLNGKVLITGGLYTDLYPASGSSVLATAEIYDPSTSTFTAIANMNVPRYGHSATLLSDGRVLIIGGSSPEPGKPYASADFIHYSTEIYDPATDTFIPAGDLIPIRVASTVLLNSGKVLAIGANIAELFDPVTSTFAPTGAYAGGVWHYGWYPDSTATLLLDGRVLITGSASGRSSDYGGGAVPQIYDPSVGTFTQTASAFDPSDSVIGFTATLLNNGSVLVCGGAVDVRTPFNAARLYDPSTAAFTSTGDMTTGRMTHTATLLLDGRVLLTGGGSAPYSANRIASSELYDPLSGTFSVTANMGTPRFGHTATLLADGTVLIAGGGDAYNSATSTAEIYHPASQRAQIYGER